MHTALREGSSAPRAVPEETLRNSQVKKVSKGARALSRLPHNWWRCPRGSTARRTTTPSLDLQEGAIHILSYSLVEELYPLEQRCAFVNGGRMGRRRDT